ncbi:MAG: TRAP transporter large permease subunit, partial [Pyramidobacter sp.]|nr:TRAP transporter large permease subunit [Pyramidobacter sp.]
LAVHFEAMKLGLSGLSRDNLPNAWKVLKEQGHMALPLVMLIGLMFAGYTPLFAAVFSIFGTFAASWLRPETRMTARKIFDATVEGAKGAISVGVCCVIIGVIIGTVTLTSLGLNMGYFILDLVKNNNIYLTGFLVMVMSTILGMGVPGVAAYVIVQAVAVPVLIKSGTSPLTSHLFCLIYACLSNITPPVAISAYVASGIAGSNQTKTGLWAVRLGAVGFIIPFFFLNNPVLLIGASPSSAAETLWAVCTALLGTAALVAGLEGWLIRKCNPAERLLLIAVAPTLLYPGYLTDAAGIGAFGAMLAWQFFRRRA